MKIGEVLKAWRKLEDLTLTQMASKIGLPFQTYHSVEKGRPMSFDTYMAIRKWLESD
jgi:transcriptional regulator with XRE-family HTH domain